MELEPTEFEGASLGGDGVPDFLEAGSGAAGEYRCADCGYGAVVRRVLPECPMCRGRSWERPRTSPFAD